MTPDSEVMARWRTLAEEALAMAERAGEDPVFRATLDLAETSGANAEAPATVLLRACATKIMPADFVWNVVQALGGRAHLLLVRVNEPEPVTGAGP